MPLPNDTKNNKVQHQHNNKRILIVYNVVAINNNGSVRRGVLATIADILISAEFSVEVAKATAQCNIILTKMITAPDQSSIEMEYCFDDGTLFFTVTGTRVHIDDSNAPTEYPQNVVDTVDDILKSIMKD